MGDVFILVEITGAEALIKALINEKVEGIFGLPGGANLPMYDTLYDSEIRHILARHEQCAAHMADGYARASRKPGVCFATSGPGATNLITGIATAFADSSPMVAITGQVATNMIGKDAFQECDTIGIATPVTKYTYQPLTSAEVPQMIKNAFHIATSGRPGPVLVDIPKNAQVDKMDITFPKKVNLRKANPINSPDITMVSKAAELLLKAERPMIMTGGGTIISGAFRELQAVAEFLMSPVVSTFKGKGGFSETHYLSLGPIGMHGHIEANKLVLEADVLLAAGARFSDRSVGKWDEFANEMKIIHADIDPSEIGKNKDADIGLIGDIKNTLKLLLSSLEQKAKSKNEDYPWIKHVKEIRDIWRSKPLPAPREITGPRLLKKMREILPAACLYTTEVGQHQMWASLHFDVIEPGTFFTSTGLGTMGWGLPAAVGAKFARPDLPVIDIAGDGSVQMTESTLATSVTEDLPVITVIFNNGMLGMVAQWQRLFYERKYMGVELKGLPDYVKIAEAYGAEGIRAQSMNEFEKALKSALNSNIATIIDVPINPEEDVFPFVVPNTALKDMVIA
ncbi:MAG: acetolactate synthase, large subunit, biosynthetic type [Thaumarchaeota archaeon]|nr:acetolactate synthase, large subunit, biosynthetic type [Nitrososphaerota archaeon]|tara:strand:- start:1683 stop:3386 length:1704 start_codon:yes stop_codon:yes gene_type:complete